jgi:diaminopimelate epimerase
MTRFVKAHACGNDFLIVEKAWIGAEDEKALAVRLCGRNTGVGADGVEYLEWTGERTGRIKLYNADGSVAEISGNGTRCVAAWMAERFDAGSGDLVSIETDAGMRQCRILSRDSHRFEVASPMGVPLIAPRALKLRDGSTIDGSVVSTGNPHFVIFVESGDFKWRGRSWQDLGREICFHPEFPEQTNVEFVLMMGPTEIEIRIFERGVGPTASSGTGTCATAAATIDLRGGAGEMRVHAPGGTQRVEWPGDDAEITLIGPAELIAAGEAY